ncbi:MAG: SHOCT domain-containing protein [Deltaproteobacteria bacterium]|nr:SHOCT domain-containing protein [Deltaproteobacteria bacterium]
MGKFFSRFKADATDPSVTSLGNLANFYSLLMFLIAIPFVLIVILVWLTAFLGLTVWLFAGFAGICGLIGWRLYRRWGSFKNKMAAQGSEFHDLMREAAKSGKNVEISLLNGTFTLRYHGQEHLGPAVLAGRPRPLALEGPLTLEAEPVEVPALLPPERLREELEGFIRLRDDGVISPEEFDRLKTSLLQRVSA